MKIEGKNINVLIFQDLSDVHVGMVLYRPVLCQLVSYLIVLHVEIKASLFQDFCSYFLDDFPLFSLNEIKSFIELNKPKKTNARSHLVHQVQRALTPKAVMNVVVMTVSNGSIITVKTLTNAYPRLGDLELKLAYQNADKIWDYAPVIVKEDIAVRRITRVARKLSEKF